MTESMICVSWWEHDCPWVSKYCYESCTRSALVPESVLRKYGTAATKKGEE